MTTLTSGERRALAGTAVGPCRRCIRSRKPWRLVVQAPLTVMNCASSASDAAMASGSLRHDNLVPVSAMPYDNVTRKHYDSGFQLTGHGVSK